MTARPELRLELLDTVKRAKESALLDIIKRFLHHLLPGLGVVPLLDLRNGLAGHQYNRLSALHQLQFLAWLQAKALDGLSRNGDLPFGAKFDRRHGERSFVVMKE